jgi:hypothetical protein
MKKMQMILTIILMIVLLPACGSDAEEEEPGGVLYSDLSQVPSHVECLHILVDNKIEKIIESSAAIKKSQFLLNVGQFKAGEHRVKMQGHRAPCRQVTANEEPVWVSAERRVSVRAEDERQGPILMKRIIP